jgi:phage shock protein PspC (stress-responsive transcriptional regulator)
VHPLKLLTAWAGALSGLGRRFQLGPNLASLVYSVTGLPEGDGLSCLGMLVVDLLFPHVSAHLLRGILTTAPHLMDGIISVFDQVC